MRDCDAREENLNPMSSKHREKDILEKKGQQLSGLFLKFFKRNEREGFDDKGFSDNKWRTKGS
jgi:hypothetical protein